MSSNHEDSSTSVQNKSATFEAFQLPTPINDALITMGYKTPTPIQERGIPLVMQGKDLIGIAQTGTGKTAAFGIPMVNMLMTDKNSQGLILVPTRELAEQVYQVMKQLLQNLKSIKPWVIIGGTSMFAQAKSMPRLPRLIIATPGRLNDHIERGTFILANVRMVVLDEADRMLDIGFEPQIRKVFPFLSKKRQTLLFSATFPKEIERLTREYMSEPAKITIGKISQPGKDIEQSFIQTTVAQKNPLLIQELTNRQGSVLIFVRTKHRVDRVTKLLQQAGFEADRIHGARTQGQRSRVMADFRNKLLRVLVATDVASRGIDINHIEHVINYDIPEVPEDYVHRIGRTARAGAKGESVSFLTPEDKTKWMYLSKHLMSMGIKLDSTMIKKAELLDEVRSSNSSVQFEKTDPEATTTPERDYSKRRHDRPKYRPKYARSQQNRPASRSQNGEQRFDRNDRPRKFNSENSRFKPRDSDRSNYRSREDGNRSNSRPYASQGDGARSSSRPYAPRGDGARSSRGYEGRSSDGNSRSFNSSRRPEGQSRERSDFKPYNRDNRNFSSRSDNRNGPRQDSRSGERSGNRFNRFDRPRTDRPRFDSRNSNDSRNGYGRSDRPRSDRPNYSSRSDSPRSSEGSNFRPRSENSRGEKRSFNGPTNSSAKPRSRPRPGKFTKKAGSYPRAGKPRDGGSRPSRDS